MSATTTVSDVTYSSTQSTTLLTSWWLRKASASLMNRLACFLEGST
ncbi:MAG TPA: hypothetical protein VN688_05700 [Gemmataceae bacterium]|nr:hypothetical protein [Gemmataceae bacterium]